MGRKPKYYSYISRAKVKQLLDQLPNVTVPPRSTQHPTEVPDNARVASDASIIDPSNPGFRIDDLRSNRVMEDRYETAVQQLATITSHIERHEKVLDLGQLCRRGGGVALDAFAYTYSGKFFALAHLSRKYGGIYISEESLMRASDEIVLSKPLLIDPARIENALAETSPNDSALVSDMCILASRVGDFSINLACSLKYFTDMGGHWYEEDKEWNVKSHTGNYRFFDGEMETWFDAMIFINGVHGTTIMGAPLFLIHRSNPKVQI